MSPGSSWGKDPHGWNRLETRLSVQDSALRQLKPFVVTDDLEGHYEGTTFDRVSGVLWCAYGIEIHVDELLELRDPGPDSRTFQDSCHPLLEGDPRRPMLRFDNAPHYVQLTDDHDEHHCHRFDLVTGNDRVEWVGRDRRPRLDAFVRIVQDWWFEVGIATSVLP